MSIRAARLLAWAAWLIGAAGIVGGSILGAAYPTESIIEDFDPIANAVWSASWLGFGFVGALIVSQRPNNRIGWVLCGITLTTGLAVIAPSYGRADLVNNGSLPLGEFFSWLGAWTFAPTAGLVVALLLLFPSGTVAARRHRYAGLALVGIVCAGTALAMVTPGPVEGDAPPVNPLGLSSWAGPIDVATQVAGTALAFLAVALLIDFLYRFWRSRGAERQQFRWLALAAGAFPILFMLGLAIEANLTGERAFDPVVVVFFLCGNGMAAAIGIAVTRYGLYEINRVVSRSVSYLALTAVLVAVYLAAVTLLTTVTAPLTRKSPIAVAAATLLAAALFGPARRRIQGAVDRRFNRARYDAAVTVDAYRGRLRDEVDLETVAADLVATVLTAMQPARTHLWLAGGAGTSQKILLGPSAVTVSERRSEKKGT